MADERGQVKAKEGATCSCRGTRIVNIGEPVKIIDIGKAEPFETWFRRYSGVAEMGGGWSLEPSDGLEVGTVVILSASKLKAKVLEVDGTRVRVSVAGAPSDWMDRAELLRSGKVEK